MSSLIIKSKVEIDNWLNQFVIMSQRLFENYDTLVDDIITNVKVNGDEALVNLTNEFDNIKLDKDSFYFLDEEINNASAMISKKEKDAIKLAASRIEKYHLKQFPENKFWVDDLGVELGYRWTPITSIGIYVPGGLASYPSSVLMNAIPARVAGVKRIIMLNPAYQGKQSPAVLYAAYKCKIKEIYCVGGAPAIAAAAYGTKKIKKVNKIVGPGNEYVAAAKKEVFGDVGIEGMTAGPSEVTIICDKFSNPEWIASDLIAQAEHDLLAQCILISKDKKLIKKIEFEINKQLKEIPRRSIAKQSLNKYGILMFINSNKKIVDVVNKIAPEHLELNVKDYRYYISKIKNAGSICTGKYAVMAMTDYNIGSNHVLPTNGSAKYSSGISVNEFYKRISYINLSKKGIESLGPSVITLANYEGLAGHAQSVKKRIRRK